MNKFKILLDIVMTILMILLMKIDALCLHAHEVIGIVIFILFLIHKIVNYKFIKAIGKNIFNKKLKLNTKIIFIFDIILVCFMFMNILTGILISKTILIGLMASNTTFVTLLHKFFAWWTLLLISIHIGLHVDRVVNYFTRKYKFLKNNNKMKIIFLILYFIIAIGGINSLCKYSIYNKIIPIYTKQIQLERESKNNNSTSKNENKPTLEEYLSQFNCEGCRRNCSLLSPKCELGKKKREEKIKEYYEIYGKEENNSSSHHEPNRYNEEEQDNIRKNKNRSNVIDVILIMLFIMGGTYYIRELLKNKSK